MKFQANSQEVARVSVTNNKNTSDQKCLHCNKRVPNLENHIKREACFTVGVYCQNCCIIFLKTKQYHNHLGICKNIAGGALKCQFCSFKFHERYALVNHLYTDHLDKIPVPHKKCKHKFWCIGLKNHHSKKCIFCECQLSTKSELLLHLFTDHKDFKEIAPRDEAKNNFECGLCQKSFSTISLLYIHHKTRACSAKKCPICLYPVENNVDLLVHVQMTHNQKSIEDKQAFICTSCVQISNSQEQLDDHYRKQHMHMCDVCGLIFQKKSCLDIHKRTDNFCKGCRMCPRVFFLSAKSVKSHMQNHVCCKTCKKYFSEEEMPKHLQEEAKMVNRLRCEFCTNLTFNNEKELDAHMHKFHFICESKFSKSFAGVEDFFINKIKLSVHLTTSKKSTRFNTSLVRSTQNLNCLHCFQPFTMAIDLENHISQMICFYSINVCRLCQRSFFTKSDYDNHLKNLYCAQNECEFCRINLLSKADFALHMYNFHREHLKIGTLGCAKCLGWCNLIQNHLKIRKISSYCKICRGIVSENLLELMVHYYEHHRNYKYNYWINCNFCCRSFQSGLEYQKHLVLKKCNNIVNNWYVFT